LPKYTDVLTDVRSSTDPDKDSYSVLWIKKDAQGRYKSLAGCHILIHGSVLWWNFCVKQENGKCFFKYPFRSPTTKLATKIGSGLTIEKVYTIEPSGLAVEVSEKMIRLKNLQDKRKLYLHPTDTKPSGLIIKSLDAYKNSPSAFWSASAGVKVKLWDTDIPDIYVMSLNTLDSLDAVYGKKKIKLGSIERSVFAPIPSTYYQVQLSSDYAINTTRASALLFYEPLENYNTDTEKWEETIYISGTSTVGPNTANIIKWLLLNYTDYAVDNLSFNDVASELPFGSNFGFYEREDTLKLCQRIAWQARCALIVDSEEISIKYLAPNPTSKFTFNRTNIERRSLKFTVSDSTEVVTKIIGTWRKTNQYNEPPTRLLQNKQKAEIKDIIRALKETDRRENPPTEITLYQENENRYGVKSVTEDFFIYDFEEPILATLNFWGHRNANVWRKAILKTFMPALILQPYDAVTLDIDLLGTIKGILESIQYNSDSKDIIVNIWLPIISGAEVMDSTVWI
jgi:hypothetical protein